MPRLEDLTGKKFGRLTVLYRAPNSSAKSGHPRWVCQCDCGNKTISHSTSLKSGNTTSCGCAKKERIALLGKSFLVDLTGQKFGMLTAMERVQNQKASGTWWRCVCDCGKEKLVTAGHLQDGHTTNCGCVKDLSGKRFGRTTVLQKSSNGKKGTKTAYWDCLCDCGTEYVSTTSRLKNNKYPACPDCAIYSAGERKVAALLDELGLPYVSEKRFDGCVNEKTGYSYRFDFFVDNRYVIEFDGIQHFKSVQSQWERIYSLDNRREHDMEKNDWCVRHNIPIIRIPYYAIDNLTTSDVVPETAEFVVGGWIAGWAYLLEE